MDLGMLTALFGLVILTFFASIYAFPPSAYSMFGRFRKSHHAYIVTYLILMYFFLDMLIIISLEAFGDDDLYALVFGFFFTYAIFLLISHLGVQFTIKFHQNIMPQNYVPFPSPLTFYPLVYNISDDKDYALLTVLVAKWIWYLGPLIFTILNIFVFSGFLSNPWSADVLYFFQLATYYPVIGPILLWAGWIVGGFFGLVVLIFLFIANS